MSPFRRRLHFDGIECDKQRELQRNTTAGIIGAVKQFWCYMSVSTLWGVLERTSLSFILRRVTTTAFLLVSPSSSWPRSCFCWRNHVGVTTLKLVFLIIIKGSQDLKIGWIWQGYRENKKHVHELKALWKRERLHSTINKYIETLTFTRLQVFSLQLVTSEMLTQVPVSLWVVIFISFLLPPRPRLLPGVQNFSPQSLTGRWPTRSLHWRNSGTGNGRKRVYTCWSSGCT